MRLTLYLMGYMNKEEVLIEARIGGIQMISVTDAAKEYLLTVLEQAPGKRFRMYLSAG